jgi:hypothetical protein
MLCESDPERALPPLPQIERTAIGNVTSLSCFSVGLSCRDQLPLRLLVILLNASSMGVVLCAPAQDAPQV